MTPTLRHSRSSMTADPLRRPLSDDGSSRTTVSGLVNQAKSPCGGGLLLSVSQTDPGESGSTAPRDIRSKTASSNIDTPFRGFSHCNWRVREAFAFIGDGAFCAALGGGANFAFGGGGAPLPLPFGAAGSCTAGFGPASTVLSISPAAPLGCARGAAIASVCASHETVSRAETGSVCASLDIISRRADTSPGGVDGAVDIS